jgi:putative glutamine amidotransferase
MQKKRPLIGITTSRSSSGKINMSPKYFNAVYDCGGIGVFLARTTDPERLRSYAEEFDGFIFSGGVDVDPAYYGESVAFDSVEIDKERDDFEIALFREVMATRKPILGICRGEQLCNVALGGSLYQHMEGHRQSEGSSVCRQPVRILSGTKLHAIIGKTDVYTNTFHHQAVKAVAPTLVASAYAEDGTVEAVEAIDYPFLLAVQWHPEMFYHENDEAKCIFEAFLAAAEA